MWEKSGSQFFRTTIEIQSGPDAVDKSRFIVAFLTILGVVEILCSFRLVLKWKTGIEIPELSRLEFLKKFSANNFALSDAEDSISLSVEQRRYSRFTFVESTIGNFPNILRAKFLGSDGLFCFTSICKFGSFKNPFATITSLSELYFRIRRFILLVQTKKVISMNYGSSASSWKPWRRVRLYLRLLMRDIYISSNLNTLTKFTSSSRSTKSKDILPWNISQMITNTIPNRSRIVISYVMKQGIPLWIWWKVNGNWDNNLIRIFQCMENHCRTNTIFRRKKEI